MVNIVLGFDFGIKRIGVAVGNCFTNTAQPLKILAAKEGQPDWQEVEVLIKEWRPQLLIIGMPYTADGTETEHILRVKKFKNRLYGRFALPVEEVDERLSSQESEQYLKPSKDKKISLDAIAAAIIVERWLYSKEMHH